MRAQVSHMNRIRSFRRSPGRQAGFTLLEAMISFLVLAIGLLGLAGLQVQGMRFNTESYARSQATFLAYDMLERMRLNRGQAATYAGGDPGGACGGGGSLAMNDRICWHQTVAATLPGGTATIVNDGLDRYTITMSWMDMNSGQVRNQTWTALLPPP